MCAGVVCVCVCRRMCTCVCVCVCVGTHDTYISSAVIIHISLDELGQTSFVSVYALYIYANCIISVCVCVSDNYTHISALSISVLIHASLR